MQQVLAFETDLLEHGDILDGSKVVEARTAELAGAAWSEIEGIVARGGAYACVEEMKGQLVRSMVERTRQIESGWRTVIAPKAAEAQGASGAAADSLGELLAQGKNNLQAPWLGLAGFLVISLMLSLLVFIGEAVRDAFDPRKTFG
jgi:hypothetical protein